MKTLLGALTLTFVLVTHVMGAGVVRQATPQEIADKPELVVSAIRNQDAEKAAGIVLKALAAIQATKWSDAKKRQHTVALITYAVAAKGNNAGPMMGLVAAGIPAASLPLVAATAVVAAGDNSPAVANAIVAAVANNTQSAEAARSACDSPTTVLLPTEVGTIRGTILPTPTQAPAKAPPLPTIIKGAEKYPGQ